MKQLLGIDTFGSYTFNKANKTITLIGLKTSLTVQNLILINNATSNIVIFSVTDITKKATITNNVITLDYDTTSMANTDILEIWVTINTASECLEELMERAVQLAWPNSVVNVNGMQMLISDANAPTYPITNNTGFGQSITRMDLVATPSLPISTYVIYRNAALETDPDNIQNLWIADPSGLLFPNQDYWTATPVQHLTISKGPVDQRWDLLIDSQTEYAVAIRNKLTWGALTITYSGNGNTGGTVPVDNKLYYSGDGTLALSNSGNLVKNASTFSGWNTLANGSGTNIAVGQYFIVTTSIPLYAKWV